MINYGLNFIFDEIIARKNRIFPLGFKEGQFNIACSDKGLSEQAILEFCKEQKIEKVNLVCHKDNEVERLINNFYSVEMKDKGIYKSIRKYLSSDSFEELFFYILKSAIRLKASDIHINTEGKFCYIKFRINGRLKTFSIIDSEYGEILGRVIKVKANCDISRTKEPLDARISLNFEGQEIDIRLAIINTINGEKISLRLLNSEDIPQNIDELGITDEEKRIIRRALGKSSGTILVTGATGSGKSTTVRCFLNEVNNGTAHIVTVEDPIEYKVDGITQIQVDNKTGNEFSTAVKSILRQDPDIIYIGEIRDDVSANVATKASITGHLVFSTLHTKTASSAIQRLETLGVDKDLIHSSLLMIINQRLIALQCKHCLFEKIYQEESLEELGLQKGDQIIESVGCELCDYSGISRRTPLMIIITFDGLGKESMDIGVSIEKEKNRTIEIIKNMFDEGEISIDEAKRFI